MRERGEREGRGEGGEREARGQIEGRWRGEGGQKKRRDRERIPIRYAVRLRVHSEHPNAFLPSKISGSVKDMRQSST